MTYLTKPFFDLVFAIVDIYPLVILLDVLGILMILFKERYEPRTFVLWLMIIIVLPVAGFLLYLLFGCTLHSMRIYGRKAEADSAVLSSRPDHAVSDGDGGVDYAVSGNICDAYWNAGDSADDLVRDITGARSSVLLEVRELKGAEHTRRTTAALAEAASRGVDVRLLTGSRWFGRTRGVDRVVKAGGRALTFHRLPYSVFSFKNANRLLRNIVVIDGRVVYTGAECVLRIEGAAADRFARRFHADWSFASGEDAPSTEEAPPKGSDVVCMVSSGPDSHGAVPSSSQYMGMLNDARREVLMTFQYLVPDEVMYNSIRLAVYDGADVRILIPRRGRHWYQAWNSLSASNPMMLAGARVYFTDKRTMRNVIIADGELCSVGTTVFNKRTMTSDFTVNALVKSERLASQMRAVFMEELEDAVECYPEEYAKRSMSDRLKIVASRILMFFNRGHNLYKRLFVNTDPQVFKW